MDRIKVKVSLSSTFASEAFNHSPPHHPTNPLTHPLAPAYISMAAISKYIRPQDKACGNSFVYLLHRSRSDSLLVHISSFAVAASRCMCSNCPWIGGQAAVDNCDEHTFSCIINISIWLSNLVRNYSVGAICFCGSAGQSQSNAGQSSDFCCIHCILSQNNIQIDALFNE